MNDIDKKFEEILKEIRIIKENQKNNKEKLVELEGTINNIKSDIYLDDSFDFEIVCPYCESEFVIDADKNKTEVKCPECKNKIELDWSGNLDEDDSGCPGSCGGCTGCGPVDEDDEF